MSSSVTSTTILDESYFLSSESENLKDSALKWAREVLDCKVQGLVDEFEALRHYNPPELTTTVFGKNTDRCRYKDKPCQDRHRVVLRWPGTQHDFIHANYISTLTNSRRFICTQGPLDNTIVDFWHMVIQEECKNIVMLCNTEENGVNKCANYWPAAANSSEVYGDVEIKNVDIDIFNPFIAVSVLHLKWTLFDEKKEAFVKHYHWIDWPENGVPPINSSAPDLLAEVLKSSKPVVVHCSGGIGRTSTFVGLQVLQERLNADADCESRVEFFKKLRDQRAYSIQTLKQYLFLNHMALRYVMNEIHSWDAETKAAYQTFQADYNALVNQKL